MNQLLRFLLFIHDIMWQYLESEEDISRDNYKMYRNNDKSYYIRLLKTR